MSIIQRIRKAIHDGDYRFTDHAVDEAQADGLLLQDVVDVLLNGDIDSTYSDDPRGTRYVLRGDVGADEVDVVCRFHLDEKTVVIITVYKVD